MAKPESSGAARMSALDQSRTKQVCAKDVRSNFKSGQAEEVGVALYGAITADRSGSVSVSEVHR